MKKIKVLQVCYSLKAAGIETFVANLQENTDTSIIENHILIYKDSEKDFFYKDIVINNGGIIENASDHSKNFLLRHIKQRFNFYKIIRKIDFDIIHVHASSGLQGLEVFLAKKFGDAKVVVHSHSSNLSLSSKFNWLKKIINQI